MQPAASSAAGHDDRGAASSSVDSSSSGSMPRAPLRAATQRDRKVAMTQTTPQSDSSWLAGEELDAARQRLPILYVDAIPVRVDAQGVVTSVGLLLRVTGEGRIARALVSGRVLYHERVRSALLRHLEKDLGPMALPRVPLAPQPFTIAEYFPTPGVTPFHDPRQHAVSLAYVVPVEGDCAPQQDALELTWFSPAGGQGRAAAGRDDRRPGHAAPAGPGLRGPLNRWSAPVTVRAWSQTSGWPGWRRPSGCRSGRAACGPRCAAWCGGPPGTWSRSPGSTSPCSPVRWSASSARTVPARPRR